MSRPRLADHGSVTNPAGFSLGFHSARTWMRRHSVGQAFVVHDVIRDSAGRSWPETAAVIGFHPTPHGEGLALGIYGLVALARLP